MFFVAGVDTHQHLWSEPLWAALEHRRQAPFIDRDRDGWTLHLPAEPACRLDGPDDAAARLALLDLDGMDGAIVAPSLALGLEWLPDDEAHTLIAAHREGIEAAGPRFDRWAVVPLGGADGGGARSCSASSTAARSASASAPVRSPPPSAWIASARSWRCSNAPARRSSSTRARAAELRHVLVHGPLERGAMVVGWLTDYVSGMQRAWFTWAAHGRRQHPELRVLFAMLGGLAPLQVSRLAARGAPGVAARAAADPLTFYDTSSYDRAAQRAVAHVVGEQQLVHAATGP